ncbi:MAG: RNA 3'-terminal phosphate cyclase [Rhodospirillales bacterium]|nr:RNA 3'-terminal phosphate cyclase [Rhodospirillales bacterium]
MSGLLTIDGSQGEGGGQILRTSLSLAAIAGRPLRIENIRARRPKPGLAAQHLTAVRAVAALCRARLAGDEIGSGKLDFLPEAQVEAGDYAFDVAAVRRGGSAGATGLVLQAVLPPLALAAGRSRVSIRGGTHVAWSPPFDYLREVWLPALGAMGIAARLELRRSGWYPIGEGQIEAAVEGRTLAERPLRPVILVERGRLLEVTGRAAAANLPVHIPRRMVERATALLAEQGIQAGIEVEVLQAACAGAGIFLTARYENLRCGFNALGTRGRPAEAVAEDAVTALLAHERSGAALDQYLADQVVLPLSLAAGPSRFTVERITGHLETNARVVELFRAAEVGLEAAEGGSGLVTVTPAG